jgi:hypothetical protein
MDDRLSLQSNWYPLISVTFKFMRSFDIVLPLVPHNRTSQTRANFIQNARVRVDHGACSLVGENASSNDK